MDTPGTAPAECHSPRDTGTKARLLEAARRIFAELGPDKARVRDICALADTNVAAVNYHFGSKDHLYFRVLDDNMRRAKERHPLDAGVTSLSTPEDRLRAMVRAMLSHFLTEEDTSARLGKLMLQEMLNPSEGIGLLIERHITPCNTYLRGIVQDLLPDAPPDIIARCTGSIIAQFALFRFDKRVRESMGPEFTLQEDDFDRVAEAIIEFSLGGIERFRSLYG